MEPPQCEQMMRKKEIEKEEREKGVGALFCEKIMLKDMV
jgi:hypothetical protein